MRKHGGDTRVRKYSRMERFLPPDHAIEQAIVQIGHHRFLQLANRFSKLFSMLSCCLASLLSGSGTGVGQLLCFVARQIQDRTEVSHLRGGVRLAGVDSLYELLFAECAISRGGSCQKSGGFHQLGKRAREEGAPPRSCGVADLALCLRSLAASKYEGRETPSEGPLLMKTSRFLAGLPCFSATKVRGVRLLGRTRVSSRTAPRGRPGDRDRVSGADRASDADSARAKSCIRALCRCSPRLERHWSE